MRHTTHGFTLIELMILVVIVGMLAAIVVPNFLAMQELGRKSKLRAECNIFRLTVEDLALQHDGCYPTTVDQVLEDLPRYARPQINPYSRRPILYNVREAGNFSFTATDTSYKIIAWGPKRTALFTLTNTLP